jgi:hypothetical protein
MNRHRIRATLFAALFISGCMPQNPSTPINNGENPSIISMPMDRMKERPTPLSFGLYVTPNPAQNPIDPPERFTGYHAALDFEVLPDEQDAPVPIYAICEGEIAYSDHAEGYGGVLIQYCVLGGQEVAVLYGHLDHGSFQKKSGERLASGDKIGILAPTRSEESGGNRKHLHLGIHKGRELEFRGYVQNENELDQFIDPSTILKQQ